jgi:two-component system response regulator PilR (NtrC family)
LDEIGDMPLGLQGKLLRFLQEKVVKPLGSDKEFPVDVRVITATNKNLEECVKLKTFREDLFYRINVVKLVLPPLRDRKEDIPVLVENFLAKTGRHFYIHPEAWRRLIVYDYPGNVRELENLLERACLLAEDAVILPEHLNIDEKEMPQSLRIVETDFNFPMDLERFLAEQEKAILTKALEQSSYNKSKAAKLLNLTMRSLRYRLSKYNLHY